MALFSKSQQPQQAQYATGVPVSVSDTHDQIGGQPKELDVEIQKYMLNVDPLLNAYYHVFSGWREIATDKVKKMYGIEVPERKSKIVIDWLSRSCNESGSNFLWNSTIGLIHQTAATSRTDRQILYDLWHTQVFTIRTTLLKTALYPTYMCRFKKCHFITTSQRRIDEHAERYDHWDIDEVLNPYELNLQRYSHVISTIITLYGIAMKSDKGFAMEKFADSFMTATQIRNQVPIVQQQGGNISQQIKRLGIG